MATLDDVLGAIGRYENRGVRVTGEFGEQAIAKSDRLDSIVADCETYARKDEHIGWGPMVKKLEGEGHSKESAEKIAGYINKKKNG